MHKFLSSLLCLAIIFIVPSLQFKWNIVSSEFGISESSKGSGCECFGYNCGCCEYLNVPKIGLNDTVCVNISYLPTQYGISLTVTIDGKVFLNETVSAKNPPPLCFGVPYLKDEASLCVDFYNLDISGHTFSGCVKIQARLVHVIVEDYDLGCFKLGNTTHPVVMKTQDNHELRKLYEAIKYKTPTRSQHTPEIILRSLP